MADRREVSGKECGGTGEVLVVSNLVFLVFQAAAGVAITRRPVARDAMAMAAHKLGHCRLG